MHISGEYPFSRKMQRKLVWNVNAILSLIRIQPLEKKFMVDSAGGRDICFFSSASYNPLFANCLPYSPTLEMDISSHRDIVYNLFYLKGNSIGCQRR
jgi:hypothetical protein